MAINPSSVVSPTSCAHTAKLAIDSLVVRTAHRARRTTQDVRRITTLLSLPSHSYRCTSCRQSSLLLRRSGAPEAACVLLAPAPPPEHKVHHFQSQQCRHPVRSRRLAHSTKMSAPYQKQAARLRDVAKTCPSANLSRVQLPHGPDFRDTAPTYPQTGYREKMRQQSTQQTRQESCPGTNA